MEVINAHARFHGFDEVERERKLWEKLGYRRTRPNRSRT